MAAAAAAPPLLSPPTPLLLMSSNGDSRWMRSSSLPQSASPHQITAPNHSPPHAGGRASHTHAQKASGRLGLQKGSAQRRLHRLPGISSESALPPTATYWPAGRISHPSPALTTGALTSQGQRTNPNTLIQVRGEVCTVVIAHRSECLF